MSLGTHFCYFQVTYVTALPIHQPPQLLGFPQIRLPQPPPLPVISFNHHYPTFKPFQPFKPFKPFLPFPPSSIISLDTMKNQVPQKGGSYNGVYMSSSSHSNGQGESELMVNINGETFHKKCKNWFSNYGYTWLVFISSLCGKRMVMRDEGVAVLDCGIVFNTV